MKFKDEERRHGARWISLFLADGGARGIDTFAEVRNCILVYVLGDLSISPSACFCIINLSTRLRCLSKSPYFSTICCLEGSYGGNPFCKFKLASYIHHLDRPFLVLQFTSPSSSHPVSSNSLSQRDLSRRQVPREPTARRWARTKRSLQEIRRPDQQRREGRL